LHDEEEVDPDDVEDAADYNQVGNLKKAATEIDASSLSVDNTPLVISSSDLEIGDERLVDATVNGNVPDPHDLIGFTFPMEHDGIVQKAVVKEHKPDTNDYFVELIDGSAHLVEYNLLLEKFNEASDNGDQIFTFSGLLNHRKVKGKWEVLVNWDGLRYEPTWEPLAHMKEADPITCALFAKENKLLDTPGWKWARRIRTMDSTCLLRLARRVFKASRSDIKYKFGVRVPRNVREALEFDRINGNTLWKDAIATEINQLLEFETFDI